MNDGTKLVEIANKIKEKLSTAKNILIISSRAPDEDCIASNVVLRWWIERIYSEVNIDSIIFAELDSRQKLLRLPKEKDSIKFMQATDFDPSIYDLVIAVDGNSWDRVFTNESASKLRAKLDLDNFYLIDHHINNDIYETIPDNCIAKLDCCCAKIVYDYFIKPSDVELTPEIATWLYFALVDDTGRFLHEMYDDTFEFAQDLTSAGADHLRVTDESMTLDEMNFMVWAIDKSDFDEEIKSSILVLDQQAQDEAEEIFGKDWYFKELFREGYTEKIKRRITGFDYGITFSLRNNSSIVAAWRTRNYGASISIQEVLESIGFDQAGGHFGAGGGFMKIGDIHEVANNFKTEMRRRLNR